jgi:hypothetical protein
MPGSKEIASAGSSTSASYKAVARSVVRVVGAAILASVSLLVSAPHANAGAYTYGTQTRTFNVAKLLVTSGTKNGSGGVTNQQDDTGDRPGPFTFYILNNRPDVKPAGWIITNPLAPKVVTTEIAKRYPTLNVGQAITPNMAPFWQLDLSDGLSISSLRQYDLLVVHHHNLVDFNASQRRLLRQYMDQGGTMLFDDCGGGDYTGSNNIAYHGFASGYGMLADVQWWNDAGATGFGVVPNTGQRHPLITVPYFLSQDEINMLGDKNIGACFMSSGRGQSNKTLPGTLTPPDPTMFTTVIGNSAHNNLPYIAAGEYGSGHIVISAADVNDDISNPVGADPTNAAYCGGDLTKSHTEDLKFMVNILAFSADSSQTESVNPRHMSTQASEFGGALLPVWRYVPGTDPNPTPLKVPYTGIAPSQALTNDQPAASTPAIYGNIAYVTDFTGILHAFDINPTEDLDADGHADDGSSGVSVTTDALTGLAPSGDLSKGVQYDQLWTYPMRRSGATGPVSSPTVAIVPGSGAASPNTLVITEDMNGNVNAVVASVNGPYDTPAPMALSTGASAGTFGTGTNYSNAVPPAVTSYRGRLYAVLPNQTLLVIDPSAPSSGGTTAATQFTVPLAGTGGVVYAPSVAGVRSNDSVFGGVDTVVTVTSSNGVCSLLMGSRDERLTAVSAPSSTYRNKSALLGYPLDLISAPEDRMSGRVDQWAYVVGANGSPSFSGLSELVLMDHTTFGATPAVAAFTVTGGNGGAVYADYDLSIKDAGTPTVVPTAPVRVSAAPSIIGASELHSVVGNAVVTPDDLTIFTANSASGSTGYIAAVRDQNPSPLNTAAMAWRFALVGTDATPVIDADGIRYSFAGYKFFGPPVIGSDNTVFALAYTVDSVSIPNRWLPIVMCFYTHPNIRANYPPLGDRSASALVQQADEFSYLTNGWSATTAGTGNLQTLNMNKQFYLDPNNGYVQFRDANGLPQPPSSPFTVPPQYNMAPNFGFPMPVVITPTVVGTSVVAPGTGTLVFYPLASSNANRPLLHWWAKLPSVQPDSLTPLRKIGNWLYVGGTPLVDPSVPVTPNYIYALNGDPVSIGVGIYGGTRLSGSTDGNSQNSTFLKKFTVDCGPAQSALVSSGRYAVVQGSDGIEGFGYLSTLVADNNRLIEFDPSGDAVWGVDSTYQVQLQGGKPPTEDDNGNPIVNSANSAIQTTSKVAINRPSTVAQITTDDFLVADSGNNRVVRFDKTGRVIWELTRFSDPNKLLGAGQPTTLNGPTSCVTWVTHAGTITTYHYLVADPGNYRVFEVVDQYDESAGAAGQPAKQLQYYHILVWVSHTFDQQGRKYRYVAAQRYAAPDGNIYIMAAVSNKRIAPIMQTAANNFVLQPASQDAEGSSIVALYYGSGYSNAIPGATSGTYADFPANGGTIAFRYYSSGTTQAPFPLITMKSYNRRVGSSPTGGVTHIRLRSLRFLVDYFRYGATNNNMRTLICDDDGVFDALPRLVRMDNGTVLSAPDPWASSPSPRLYSWTLDTSNLFDGDASLKDPYRFSFLQSEYDLLASSYVASDGTRPYRNTTFIPSSALLLGNGDYLIANRSSSGDPNAPQGPSGGNAFELLPGSIASGSQPKLVGPMYGIPTNSGAIVQPAFALRPI